MEKKITTVTNISAIKRIAYFLCDLVINFFFGLMIINFAVYPIGRSIINFVDKIATINKCEDNKIKILEENSILLYKEEASKRDFNASLQYTFESFTQKLVEDKENETVIYRYFVDIKNDKSTYINYFSKINQNKEYFAINDNVTLKDEYKTLFAPYFNPLDSLSEQGDKEFKEFKENVFVDLYEEVIKDIKVNDLKSGDLSYKHENDLSDETTKSIANFYSLSTLIGYVIVTILYFIVIPISNEHRYTLSQFFLKTNRVDCSTLKTFSRKNVLIMFVIQLIANMALIVFIPSLTIGVEAAFSLPYLSILTLLAAVYSLVSMFFIVFNEFNKSLYDIFSNSVIIDREDYEKIIYNVGNKNGTTK